MKFILGKAIKSPAGGFRGNIKIMFESYKKTPETDLIKDAINGNLKAFDEIVKRYSDKVYRLCFYYFRNSHEAEDAAQEVFISVYKGLKNFRGESGLGTWIYRITANQCKSVLRAVSYKKNLEQKDIHDGTFFNELPSNISTSTPEEEYIKDETMGEITDAVKMLPENMMEVIVLKDFDNRSYEEISEILSINIGTVRSRISRARVELKKILTEVCGYGLQ
jgi:RNA polymerase sigma-70 factor (ECF subfamily)